MAHIVLNELTSGPPVEDIVELLAMPAAREL